MSDNPSITIPKDLLMPAIEAHVRAGIVAALGDHTKIIEEIARQACMVAVDRKTGGAPGRYASDGEKVPLLTYLTESALRGVVKEEIRKWVEEQREEIAKVVRKTIRLDQRLAKSLCDGFIDAVTRDISYSFSVRVGKSG